MQKKITKYSLLFILLMTHAISFPVVAQTTGYASTKEKIYIQTSHVFFKPGEQVYFKIYLVNAQTQAVSQQSKVVYAELLNPSGNVVQKLNYKIENGYAEGSFDFDAQAVGGIYKIKAYTTWMRNENEDMFFVKEITVQKVIAPRILMKLDFPAKGYGAGDEVTADFSMRNLSDQPIRYYPATFTVSLAGEVIEKNILTTNNEGKSSVKFILPKNLKTNDGLLNIIISYDSYTEAISRSIPIVLNKIDLQFMPEGGSFVEGIPTQIAFKALNENGKAADIKGEVWDNRGRKVIAFESYHFGMGKFPFTAQRGLSYKVKIISPANILREFELPVAAPTGVVLNVSRIRKQVMVTLNATQEMQVKLVGQSRDINYYEKNITLQRGENTISVDETIFPVGIAQFTVYTSYDAPLAERVVFLNEDRNLQVSITTDKQKYLPREKVIMSLQTRDEKGRPVPSNLSLAVMDDKLWSFADDKQDHILSWLLMSSELKGKVEEPQFYFKKDEPKAIPALDLVMLTNGYRYFDYIQYVQKEERLKFFPDQDNMLSGIIMDGKEKPVRANLYLVNAKDQKNALHVKTAADGLFFFSELTPGNDYFLLAQAMNKKDKVSIRVLQNGVGYNPLKVGAPRRMIVDDFAKAAPVPMVEQHIRNKDELEEQRQVMKEDKQMEMDRKFNVAGQLNEVVVVGFGAARKRDMAGAVANLRGDEILGFADINHALQGRAAGVQIVENANAIQIPAIKIRGVGSLTGSDNPLIVVNGLPMDQYRPNGINANDIESVTVLKDAAATAVYGAKAANGVIIIETKKFRNEKIRFNLTHQYYFSSQTVRATGPVYAVARKFYAPRYTSLDVTERTDFRETIYWNPVVQTDKNGTASVEFYNSDASTTFRAIAEGIGYNGNAGRAEATYTVQNALSVDAKIPPYLTVGDKALIPLVIKNNSIRELTIAIRLELPSNMEAGDYTNKLVLAPGSSRQVLVPVEAKQATNGIIRFSVTSELAKETLALPVVANDKGFPVILTFAGNKSRQYDFNINKAIPGSMKTELKLFKNLEGQLLDGIESMLREPGGCFEQTSSSLYPNIYVLKYLRTAGKSNPEVEKRAMGYIENGYKRLLGFETAKNGFEWFGKTPPHEALTAYGLLEFTDMQEFIKVDQQMMERTKKFLLDRRDGKGSFTLVSGGYDQFAAVPNKIANIYIVYALTQAGLGKEIQPEYAAAVKKAMDSKDGYQLAMMALAASNMKNEKDFKALIEATDAQYQKTKLLSETSVVNSRDASLRVETLSLYALALMREKTPQVAVIAEAITKILAEKSYYGYGATQATVLALQAIVEYSKLIGSVNGNTQILFTMNNKKADKSSDISPVLQDGKNVFAVTYGDEKKTIPYNLEVSYNTFTPPNSEKAELKLATRLTNAQPKVGETTRMEIEVTNEKNILQPMSIAKIGIPAGLAAQPWQLKEIMEKNEVAYYEIFDNYLVFYWMGFKGNETKKINLDLKAEIPGTYKGKASTTYLYYTPEYRHWNDGVEVEVRP